MATHSSILAWEMLRTEEYGGLQSMGSQRVRHELVTEQQQQSMSKKITDRVYSEIPTLIVKWD